MSKITIGDYFIRDKRQFEIKSIGGSTIQIEDVISLIASELSYSEMSDLIFRGEAQIVSSKPKVENVSGDKSRDFSSYPENLKAVALYRWKFVKCVLVDNNVTKFSPKWLDPLIVEVVEEYQVKIVSWRTLKRWLDRYVEMGMRGLIPMTELKGNRESRVPEETDSYIYDALMTLKNKEKISYNTAFTKFKDWVLIENSTRADDIQLPLITYQSFIKRAAKLAPYDVMVAQLGKAKADILFSTQRKAEPITKILDRAEIDHTTLDLFIIDEYLRLPLGRPTVTAVLDRKSRSILGAYIGFEPPSFLSISKAVKNAISDKTALMAEYPSVKGKWHCRGVFTYIATDVGIDFTSKMFEESLLDLGTTIVKNPVKKPWYKGAVESYFKTLNQTLLDDKPGKVFASLFDSNDYNPEKNAVISMTTFMDIFYCWLVDIYHCTPKGEDKVIPNISWLEDEVNVDTDPVSPERLDIIFSENDTRDNRSKGIVINNLWYSSNTLTKLRQSGYISEQKIKTNRENLSCIKVLNPISKTYFDVPAVDQDYTKDLTLHQHQIIQKYRNKYALDNTDELSLAQARKRIEDIIDKEIVLNRRMKISASKQLSRYRNIEGGGNSSVVSDEQKAKIDLVVNQKNKPSEETKTTGMADIVAKLKADKLANKENDNE
jgi:putative transposase